MNLKSNKSWRLWMRDIHRELSYLFAGMLLIYAISGFVLNHRNITNLRYTINVQQLKAPEGLTRETATEEAVLKILEPLEEADNYAKHYFPEENIMKVLLRGGSNLTANLSTGEMTYEKLSRRPVISSMTRLHYNPSKWWTYFSDAFIIGMVIITLTGLVMVKGKHSLLGRSGILFLAGIVIPLIFLFFF